MHDSCNQLSTSEASLLEMTEDPPILGKEYIQTVKLADGNAVFFIL